MSQLYGIMTDFTKQIVQIIHGQRKHMNRLSIYSPSTDEINTLNKGLMTATNRYAMIGNVDDCEKAEAIGT